MSIEIKEHREWLSVKEIAFELGLHPTAVYRAIDNGALPALRLHEHGAPGYRDPNAAGTRTSAASPWPSGERRWRAPCGKPGAAGTSAGSGRSDWR